MCGRIDIPAARPTTMQYGRILEPVEMETLAKSMIVATDDDNVESAKHADQAPAKRANELRGSDWSGFKD